MSETDTDLDALRERIRDLQTLLADVLPELAAYYEQKKANTDRSAIHQGNTRELRDLVNRVATQLGKPPIEG